MTRTKRPSKASLSDALDAAMQTWARRDKEPQALVARRLDDLHAAWAASRFADDDDQPATPPASASQRRANRDRTADARREKQDRADDRIRWIVERFHTIRPRCSSDREAHDQIAAEVLEGRHLTWLPKSKRQLYVPQTYHAGSVKRILRSCKAR
jgi:hypothetical protein